MPELPEVETIAADLRPHLVGRTILRCELAFPTIVRHPEPEEFIDSVAGMRIESVGRRGKYIFLRLEKDVALVVHLGMTGQLRLFDPVAQLEKHTHAVFTLDDGKHLRYRDPRRFGRLLLGTEETLLLAKKMPRLGPEPIDPDFAAEELYRRLKRRRAPLKAVLLDQQAIAGLGNMIVDEVLWWAGLDPHRAARDLTAAEVAALHRQLRRRLPLMLRRGGSHTGTLSRPVRSVVAPCSRCGGPLARSVVGGRTTVWCPAHQR